MLKYVVIGLTGLLVGCASTQQSSQNANPAEQCRSLGLKEGTEGYSNCVSNNIHQHCMSLGLQPGSPEYAECESNLRSATFLRQQMQIQGL